MFKERVFSDPDFILIFIDACDDLIIMIHYLDNLAVGYLSRVSRDRRYSKVGCFRPPAFIGISFFSNHNFNQKVFLVSSIVS